MNALLHSELLYSVVMNSIPAAYAIWSILMIAVWVRRKSADTWQMPSVIPWAIIKSATALHAICALPMIVLMYAYCVSGTEYVGVMAALCFAFCGLMYAPLLAFVFDHERDFPARSMLAKAAKSTFACVILAGIVITVIGEARTTLHVLALLVPLAGLIVSIAASLCITLYYSYQESQQMLKTAR